MQRADAVLLSLLAAVVTYLVPGLYSTSAPPPAPVITCKKTGPFGMHCSKGCTRSKGACVPAASSAAQPQAASAPSVAAADALMRKRSVDNCLAAADIYEAASEVGSDVAASAVNKMHAADALNCAMRIKGTGNILLLEGTLDTPDNKKFWGAHGPRALTLVRAARAAHAPYRSDASSAAAEMDAFMYSSSSKGILRQAVTGAGTTFRVLAEELVSAYLPYDGGVGHCYLGGFYTVAPWPLGDKKRGLAEMEAAFKYEPRARRNGYYACILRYIHNDYAGAAAACETALSSGRCDGPTTPDYCTFLTTQTKRVLALAKAKA